MSGLRVAFYGGGTQSTALLAPAAGAVPIDIRQGAQLTAARLATMKGDQP